MLSMAPRRKVLELGTMILQDYENFVTIQSVTGKAFHSGWLSNSTISKCCYLHGYHTPYLVIIPQNLKILLSLLYDFLISHFQHFTKPPHGFFFGLLIQRSLFVFLKEVETMQPFQCRTKDNFLGSFMFMSYGVNKTPHA